MFKMEKDRPVQTVMQLEVMLMTVAGLIHSDEPIYFIAAFVVRTVKQKLEKLE